MRWPFELANDRGIPAEVIRQAEFMGMDCGHEAFAEFRMFF